MKESSEYRPENYQFSDPSLALTAIEYIDSVIRTSSNVNFILNTLMERMLKFFQSSRAWVFYPCNPEISEFEVVFESNLPEFPGAKSTRQNVPMTDDMADYCRRALIADGCPDVDPVPGQPMTNDIALHFNVKSLLFMALKPNTGEPWMLGLHQCDTDRIWTDDEKHLFRIIGQRITGCIDNLLLIQKLRNSEKLLDESQEVSKTGSFSVDARTLEIQWSKQQYRNFGYQPNEIQPDVDTIIKHIHPEDQERFIQSNQTILSGDCHYNETFRIIGKDGIERTVHSQAKLERDDSGQPIRTFGSTQDITEKQEIENALHRIEWMLTSKPYTKISDMIGKPDYGDLSTINKNRTILDAVGKDLLQEIVRDYVDLLDTSAAVYEANGDYALGIFSSNWCRFLDQSSRNLCHTDDNVEALNSGNWLCHESCWNGASKRSMDTGKAVDIKCAGGLRIFAQPIFAGDRIVGSINVGYGDPPSDIESLNDISKRFQVSIEDLKKQSQAYESRPPYIIELAKRRLAVSARLIGEIVERKRMEKEVQRTNERLSSMWNIAQMTEADHHELCDLILFEIQKLTDSSYAFFGFLSEDEKYMTIHAWSHEAMSDCQVEDKTLEYPIEDAGMWSYPVTTHEPLIINDYSLADPRKKGLPDGHVPITKLVSVPIIRNGKTIAIAAVANKPTEYTDFDVKQVQLFVSSVLLLLEKKIADQDLHDSEERYRSLVMQSTDCLILHDFDGRIQDVNICSCDTYGYTRKEFLEMKIQDLDPDYSERTDNGKFYEQIIPGQATVFYARQRAKNGREFPVEVRLSLIQLHGKTLVQGLCRDISEKIENERRLRRAQNIESIGNLAGGIAHDFNNILASILGYTELALDDAPDNSELSDSLNEIYLAGTRARDLVKQILAFARQSDDKMLPTRLSDVINEGIKFMRSTLPSTIEILQEISTDALIMGNATQIHRVLTNLCTNAAQAMEENGGLLKVILKKETITRRNALPDLVPGEYLKLQVSDTGTGINEDVIGSIFDPYFTTKKVGEGTGMGLALVHGVVESHRGKIYVDSEPGQGTCFSIYLPETSQLPDEIIQIAEPLPTGSERILLIDDEMAITQMTSKILENLGYQVTYRTDSSAALELFKRHPDDYDLIITDMTMPELTGDKLAIEVMKVKPGIPVIICTGYSRKMSNEVAESLGIRAFLYKPITRTDLAKIVRKTLDT